MESSITRKKILQDEGEIKIFSNNQEGDCFIFLPYDPAIMLPEIYTNLLKTFVHAKTCTQMFIIAKTWKQSYSMVITVIIIMNCIIEVC